MDDSAQGDAEYVKGKVQWRVGIAALRKMRHVIDGYEKDERFNRAAAKYLLAGFVLALILAIVIAWISPATIMNLFRSLS